jgi:hypothetical protein
MATQFSLKIATRSRPGVRRASASRVSHTRTGAIKQRAVSAGSPPEGARMRVWVQLKVLGTISYLLGLNWKVNLRPVCQPCEVAQAPNVVVKTT